MKAKEILKAAFFEARKIAQPCQDVPLFKEISAQADENFSRWSASFSEAARSIIQKKYPFLDPKTQIEKELNKSDFERWTNLLAWIDRELNAWSSENDSKCITLYIIFLIIDIHDCTEIFWDELSEKISQNNILLCTVEQWIKTAKTSLTAVDSISQTERNDQLKEADLNEDWLEIANATYRNYSLPTKFLLVQASRCLSRFNFKGLVLATNDIKQSVLVQIIINSLSAKKALELSLQSKSRHLKFVGLFSFVSRRSEEITDLEKNLICELLLQISTDSEFWPTCIKALNINSSHSAILPEPLGKALAKMSDEGIFRYVDGIPLTVNPSIGHRKTVTNCLIAFHQSADLLTRKKLWKTIFSRWNEWNFEGKLESRQLPRPVVTIVDYAIVGFLVESSTKDDIAKEISTLICDTSLIEKDWHKSQKDFWTVRNRLISRLQPFMHAEQVLTKGVNWEYTECSYKIDFGPNKDYFELKYTQ